MICSSNRHCFKIHPLWALSDIQCVKFRRASLWVFVSWTQYSTPLKLQQWAWCPPGERWAVWGLSVKVHMREHLPRVAPRWRPAPPVLSFSQARVALSTETQNPGPAPRGSSKPGSQTLALSTSSVKEHQHPTLKWLTSYLQEYSAYH